MTSVIRRSVLFPVLFFCLKGAHSAEINFDTCKITGKSSISIDSLFTGRAYDLNKTFQVNYGKQKPSWQSNLLFNNDATAVTNNISLALGKPSSSEILSAHGAVEYRWDNNMNVSWDGSPDKANMALGIPVNKVRTIAGGVLLSDSLLLDDFNKAFSGKKSKEYTDGGDYITRTYTICDGLSLRALFKRTATNEKNKFLSSGHITINLSERDQNTKSVSNNPVIATTATKARLGDSIIICMKNGKTCRARMLTPGEDESEIQFKEWCDVALFTGKSSGEKMWVPNSSISRSASECN